MSIKKTVVTIVSAVAVSLLAAGIVGCQDSVVDGPRPASADVGSCKVGNSCAENVTRGQCSGTFVKGGSCSTTPGNQPTPTCKAWDGGTEVIPATCVTKGLKIRTCLDGNVADQHEILPELPWSMACGTIPGEDVVYDGQTYKTVVIDNLVWFAENLNYTKILNYTKKVQECSDPTDPLTCEFENPCPDPTDLSTCGAPVMGQGDIVDVCNASTSPPVDLTDLPVITCEENYLGMCYEDDPTKCDDYGRLYRWVEAMDLDVQYETDLWAGDDANHQGICPDGWRVPSKDDWDALVASVYDGVVGAGTVLKSHTDWDGTDKYGFSALPGGLKQSGTFNSEGDAGNWWSAAGGTSDDTAYSSGMSSADADVDVGVIDKGSAYSLRCVRDVQ